MVERAPNTGTEGGELGSDAVSIGRHSTETEVAHARLRGAILRGELAAGAILKQGELAATYGVGRTPLREALRLLEREGLVEAEPQRRARVAAFSVDDLEQLYAMRIELEALAIRHTVIRLSDEELRKLAGLLSRMEESAQAEDYDRWEIPHRDFHSGLVAHAGDRMLRTIRQLSDHAERYRHHYTMNAPYAWSRGVQEHEDILDAATKRDPDLAAERLVRHYSTVVLSSIALLAPEHEPTLVRTAFRTATRSRDVGGREPV